MGSISPLGEFTMYEVMRWSVVACCLITVVVSLFDPLVSLEITRGIISLSLSTSSSHLWEMLY